MNTYNATTIPKEYQLKKGYKKWVKSVFILSCCLLLVTFCNQNTYAQCSAISSINFAANNPADPNAYFGDGSNDFIKESLEPQDYGCFTVVPFLIELEIDPDAECENYVVELPVQWLCNTTGQGGIGVSEIISYQINPSLDPGSANLDGDEDISLLDSETDGVPLEGNAKCFLNGTFEISGLDPGDVVIVRIDVLLDCDLTSSPTGNIQASLGEFDDIKITSGDGTDCGCDNLQGGAQTIPWTVDLPDCMIECSIDKNQDVTCNGGNDGSATVVVMGAVGNVTYAWPTGDNTATVDDLPAGTYTVTVYDELPDCSSTCMVTITEPDALECDDADVTDVDCYGESTGEATINVSGGTPPYDYNWGDLDGDMADETGATQSNLPAGTYYVTVTDYYDCEIVCEVTIDEPDELECEDPDVTDVDCYGESTGSATINVSGGTPPYNYDWGDLDGDMMDETGATQSNLPAGTYYVTVTDDNDCEIVCEVTIDEPTGLVCEDPDVTDVECNGEATGSATINVSGGTPPYDYNWGDLDGDMIDETGATQTGLTAGTYYVTVTDDNDCEIECEVTVAEASTLVCEDADVTDVDCYGASTGSATINVSGGTPPYDYNWGDLDGDMMDETGATQSNLPAGTYYVTVTDDNDCEIVCEVTIDEPTELVCEDPDVTDVECNGEATGSATINVSGGTPPYDYNWGDLDGDMIDETGATQTGLTAGTYYVTVTDDNDCEIECEVTIDEPTGLVCEDPDVTDVDCYGEATGSATINVSGGTPPYAYNWGDLDGDMIDETGATQTGLTADTYYVTVTDDNDCEIVCEVTIDEPTELVCEDPDVTDVDCYGEATGSATINVSGGTPPYAYNWGDLDGDMVDETGATQTGLTAGSYYVTVTDDNDCEVECEVTVGEPDLLSCEIINDDGVTEICLEDMISLTAAPSGGTPPYTYAWSSDGSAMFSDPTGSTTTVSGFSEGVETITLEITDANLCVTTCTIMITAERCVEACTWTPGFWKNHPEEICGVLGGTVTRYRGQKTCTGDDETIGFELCGMHYTLSASDIACLFAYSSDTRGNKTPSGCSAEVAAIAEYFAQFPNGVTLLHHILAAQLNLLYNGANFGSLDLSDFVCVEDADVDVPGIFQGTIMMDEVSAIAICLDGASASDISEYIEPLTAYNECEDDCGLPSQEEANNSSYGVFNNGQPTRFKADLSVFPNPAQDKVNIRFNLEEDRTIQIQVMDINGRVFQAAEIDAISGLNTETIDLTDLANGLYLIQIRTGTEIRTKRFVKANH